MSIIATKFNTSLIFLLLFVTASLSQFNVVLAQNNPFAGSYSGKFTYTIVGDNEKKTGTGSFSLQVNSQGHVVVKSAPMSFEFDINAAGHSLFAGKFFGTQSGSTGIGSVQFIKHNNRKVVSGGVNVTYPGEDDIDPMRQSSLKFNGLGAQDTSSSPGAKVNAFAGSYSGNVKVVSARGTTYSGSVSVVVDRAGGVTVIGVPHRVRFMLNANGGAHLTFNTGKKIVKWEDDNLLSGDFQIQFKLETGRIATFSGKGSSKYTDGSIATGTFSGSGTTDSGIIVAQRPNSTLSSYIVK